MCQSRRAMSRKTVLTTDFESRQRQFINSNSYGHCPSTFQNCLTLSHLGTLLRYPVARITASYESVKPFSNRTPELVNDTTRGTTCTSMMRTSAHVESEQYNTQRNGVWRNEKHHIGNMPTLMWPLLILFSVPTSSIGVFPTLSFSSIGPSFGLLNP